TATEPMAKATTLAAFEVIVVRRLATPFPTELYLRRPSYHLSTNSTLNDDAASKTVSTSAIGMFPFSFELKISTASTRIPPPKIYGALKLAIDDMNVTSEAPTRDRKSVV